jgi:hypothetical protein
MSRLRDLVLALLSAVTIVGALAYGVLRLYTSS